MSRVGVCPELLQCHLLRNIYFLFGCMIPPPFFTPSFDCLHCRTQLTPPPTQERGNLDDALELLNAAAPFLPRRLFYGISALSPLSNDNIDFLGFTLGHRNFARTMLILTTWKLEVERNMKSRQSHLIFAVDGEASIRGKLISEIVYFRTVQV